ncbi:MAG: mechanosensitive ion channel protein MscL [Acidiphilium sp. 34-60-192]|nr:MAG: mechanosensitive ion channel protein MscL [Acidiphilium sp. 34-60-192]
MVDLPPIKKPGWVGEFQAFLMRGNVVDLAVAVVIGAAFTKIVNSLVADLINPLIGLVTGGVDFSNHFATLSGKVEPTLAAAKKADAVINFVIVAFAIFWLVRMIQKLYAKPAAPAAPPPPTVSESLLTEIRDLLKSAEAK